jgi:uncharacterized protein YozE (UPF0346 family)
MSSFCHSKSHTIQKAIKDYRSDDYNNISRWLQQQSDYKMADLASSVAQRHD